MNRAGTLDGWRWLFHSFVLWSFAVAQPLYAKVAENLPFLLAHRADSLDVIAYSLMLLLPGPLLIWLAVVVAWRLSPRAGLVLRAGLVGALVALTIFPLLKPFDWLPQSLGLLTAVFLGAIPAVGYRTRFWRGLLDVLTPAPILFLAYFLLFSPVQVLIVPERDEAPAETGGRTDIPVVIVLFDELPSYSMLDEAGALDARRLPGFARLAETSTWYPDATTVADATVMAVPSLLTGVWPVDERREPPVFQHFPENLFEQLGGQRRIWAIENGSRLCRPSLCPGPAALAAEPPAAGAAPIARFGGQRRMLADSVMLLGHMSLPDRLAARLPELGTRWAGFAQAAIDAEEAVPADMRWDRRVAEFELFLEQLGGLEPDHLIYKHAMLPHAPWMYLPDGRAYDLTRGDSTHGLVPDGENEAGLKHLWYDDEWAVTIGEQRYLLQLGYVDRLIDRMLDRLEASGHWDDALVVVTADHGAAFTGGTSRRALTGENFAEILGVPLFIKYPGQTEGRVHAGRAELLDVAPTVRDVLELEAAEVEGRSLLDSEEQTPRPRLVNEHNERHEFSASRYRRDFARVLDRMHQRFEFAGQDHFPKLRERVRWYGAGIDELRVRKPADGASLKLFQSGAWRQVEAESPFLPVRVEGRLSYAGHASDVLLAALNDRIAGVGRPFAYPGSDGLFELMLEPGALVSGSNDLAIYRLREDESGQYLEVLYRDRRPARIIEREGMRLLDIPDFDEPLPLAPGPPYGEVAVGHDPVQNIHELRGWAADTTRGRPASAVHVFIDEDWVGGFQPVSERPDLVERFGWASLHGSGFLFPLALADDRIGARPRLTVVAVDHAGRAAAELNYIGMEQEDWPFSRPADYRAVPIPRAPALGDAAQRYRPGTWLKFDPEKESGALVFAGEWYRPGQGIRWSGRQAELRIPVAASGQRWQLEVEAIPFVHEEEVTGQRVEVSIAGRVVDHWRFEGAGIQKRETVFNVVETEDDDWLRLAFSMPDAAVPAELGDSPDRRPLGLAFYRIRLNLAGPEHDD